MEFTCRDNRNKWVKWFAWHPVHVGDNKWVWLEPVERYDNGMPGHHYKYRKLTNGDFTK